MCEPARACARVLMNGTFSGPAPSVSVLTKVFICCIASRALFCTPLPPSVALPFFVCSLPFLCLPFFGAVSFLCFLPLSL